MNDIIAANDDLFSLVDRRLAAEAELARIESEEVELRRTITKAVIEALSDEDGDVNNVTLRVGSGELTIDVLIRATYDEIGKITISTNRNGVVSAHLTLDGVTNVHLSMSEKSSCVVGFPVIASTLAGLDL